MRKMGWRSMAAVFALSGVALTGGCSTASSLGASPDASPTASASKVAVGYWTHARLLAAQPLREWTPPSSPWIIDFYPRTRVGTIVGYQEGGDTDSISYSVYLNDNIRALYEQAEAAG